MSSNWLSEKEKREMLAFALSDDVAENDVDMMKTSLMKHLNLSPSSKVEEKVDNEEEEKLDHVSKDSEMSFEEAREKWYV
jgi:hypothetical protein